MKKKLLCLTPLLFLVVAGLTQMPVFYQKPSYQMNKGHYYSSRPFTPVRSGGFDYNPPSYSYNNEYYNYNKYYQSFTPVRSGGFDYNPPSYSYNNEYYNYNKYYQLDPRVYYNSYKNNYLNNCFPYQQIDYYRQYRRDLIIRGAVQIIDAITLPNKYNYSPYYGGYYQY